MTYTQIMRRIAKANEAKDRAAVAARLARQELDVWGIGRFVLALAKRGIVPNDTLIEFPGRPGQNYPFKAVCQPCAARYWHIAVDAKTMERGALGPNTTCTSEWWTFRLSIQRQKKDGGLRNEDLTLWVHGDTPEAAARQVRKWAP